MKLSGNKILITGATEGIGRALTMRFLELGNHIIAVARNEEKLSELQKPHADITPFPCDLADSAQLERLATFVKQSHKDLNVLINNAGIQYNYSFEEEENPIPKIQHEIEVNLTAPLKLTAMLLPVLEKNENAAVVNVSSGLGLVPKRQTPVYCAAKAAIHIFSKSLRYQLEKVKVFEIIPPLVDTNMTRGRGKGKISPEKLVDEFISSFRRNRYEISIGKVKLLKLINRLSPALADRIMKGGK